MFDASEVNRLAADLQRAEQVVGRRVGQVTRASTLRGEALTKRNAPVLTGYLRNSVTSDYTEQGNTYQGEFGPEAAYGAFLEHGTSRMPPQPYVGPAADIVGPQFVAAVEAIADPFDGRG